MIVKSENDKMMGEDNLGVYRYGDGQAQDALEKATLEHCLLPGLNNRLGMPAKATLKQAVRESAQNQIVQLCQLPPSQTRRCLILRAFEDMMRKNLKERQFSFLDRHFIEEYKDAHTMRQALSSAMLKLRADVATEYFEMEDGLLVSMFFKNPPGRLLRRQWTQPAKVFPDFAEWNSLLEKTSSKEDEDKLQEFLDIPAHKVGVLKSNTKFSFPSDNSIIRVDKYYAGQKRMGESQIIKDNFVFGLCERKEVYDNKVDGEDELRNRDAKKQQDKRSDFWLVFENGVRLAIEMQDHMTADMENIPPSQMPKWLRRKMEQEQKKLAEQEDSSVEQLNAQSPAEKQAEGDADAQQLGAGGSGMQSDDEGRASARNEPFRKSGQSAFTNKSKDSKNEKKDDQDAKP